MQHAPHTSTNQRLELLGVDQLELLDEVIEVLVARVDVRLLLIKEGQSADNRE